MSENVCDPISNQLRLYCGEESLREYQNCKFELKRSKSQSILSNNNSNKNININYDDDIDPLMSIKAVAQWQSKENLLKKSKSSNNLISNISLKNINNNRYLGYNNRGNNSNNNNNNNNNNRNNNSANGNSGIRAFNYDKNIYLTRKNRVGKFELRYHKMNNIPQIYDHSTNKIICKNLTKFDLKNFDNKFSINDEINLLQLIHNHKQLLTKYQQHEIIQKQLKLQQIKYDNVLNTISNDFNGDNNENMDNDLNHVTTPNNKYKNNKNMLNNIINIVFNRYDKYQKTNPYLQNYIELKHQQINIEKEYKTEFRHSKTIMFYELSQWKSDKIGLKIISNENNDNNITSNNNDNNNINNDYMDGYDSDIENISDTENILNTIDCFSSDADMSDNSIDDSDNSLDSDTLNTILQESKETELKEKQTLLSKLQPLTNIINNIVTESNTDINTNISDETSTASNISTESPNKGKKKKKRKTRIKKLKKKKKPKIYKKSKHNTFRRNSTPIKGNKKLSIKKKCNNKLIKSKEKKAKLYDNISYIKNDFYQRLLKPKWLYGNLSDFEKSTKKPDINISSPHNKSKKVCKFIEIKAINLALSDIN